MKIVMYAIVLAVVLGVFLGEAQDQHHHHHHHHSHGGGKYKIQKIYGDAAVQQCAGNFGSPKLQTNADFSKVYIISDCCAENGCVEKPKNGGLGDYSRGLYAVMMSGKVDYSAGTITWDQKTFTNVSVPYDGNPLQGAGVHSVRDKSRDRIVLFGMYKPSGDSRKSYNATYSIRFATDAGNGIPIISEPFDITPQIKHCSPDPNNMMDVSAGTGTQTSSGRLLVPGHDHNDHGTVFYSDDGGLTWNCSNIFDANEISVAEIPNEPGHIYITGRPQHGWNPHRSSYWSTDNGLTFQGPVKCDDLFTPGKDQKGCERAMVAGSDGKGSEYLISSEPFDKHRHNMYMACSRDGGHTWKNTLSVNDGAVAGYSNLVQLKDGNTAIAWQDKKAHAGQPSNFVATIVGPGWC